MLLEMAKNKKDERQAISLWDSFAHKNGHKGVDVNNLNYTYCHYKIEKRYYSGYFLPSEIDLIFNTLDYFEGKILGLAG